MVHCCESHYILPLCQGAATGLVVGLAVALWIGIGSFVARNSTIVLETNSTEMLDLGNITMGPVTAVVETIAQKSR